MDDEKELMLDLKDQKHLTGLLRRNLAYPYLS